MSLPEAVYCDECLFWTQEEDNYFGRCHKFPPALPIDGDTNQFTRTDPSDFCFSGIQIEVENNTSVEG